MMNIRLLKPRFKTINIVLGEFCCCCDKKATVICCAGNARVRKFKLDPGFFFALNLCQKVFDAVRNSLCCLTHTWQWTICPKNAGIIIKRPADCSGVKIITTAKNNRGSMFKMALKDVNNLRKAERSPRGRKTNKKTIMQ